MHRYGVGQPVHVGAHADADGERFGHGPNHAARAIDSVRNDRNVSRAPRRRLALAGAAAGPPGGAASTVVITGLNAPAAPGQTVPEVVIAKTPGPVADSLIPLVGRNDKPFL